MMLHTPAGSSPATTHVLFARISYGTQLKSARLPILCTCPVACSYTPAAAACSPALQQLAQRFLWRHVMLARAAAAASRGLRPRARAVQHYAPSGEWLELEPSAALEADAVTVNVGLTNDALDAVGDVRAIRWTAQPGAPHAAHAAVAELDWEGFTVRPQPDSSGGARQQRVPFAAPRPAHPACLARDATPRVLTRPPRAAHGVGRAVPRGVGQHDGRAARQQPAGGAAAGGERQRRAGKAGRNHLAGAAARATQRVGRRHRRMARRGGEAARSGRVAAAFAHAMTLLCNAVLVHASVAQRRRVCRGSRALHSPTAPPGPADPRVLAMRRARSALAALRAARAAQGSEACAFGNAERTICVAARSLAPPCSQLSAARAAREAEFRARSQLRRWSSTQRAPAVEGAAVACCFALRSLTRAAQAGCPLRCARAWRSCGSATTTFQSRYQPTCARFTRRTPQPCRRPPHTRPRAAAAAAAGPDRDHQQGAGAAEPRDGRLRGSEQAGRRKSAACDRSGNSPLTARAPPAGDGGAGGGGGLSGRRRRDARPRGRGTIDLPHACLRVLC